MKCLQKIIQIDYDEFVSVPSQVAFIVYMFKSQEKGLFFNLWF
jgi:hypothetical protein